MASLGVNIDHIANIRQAQAHGGTGSRPLRHCSRSWGGLMASPCICREDRRHIQDRDVELLRQTVRSRLNLGDGRH